MHVAEDLGDAVADHARRPKAARADAGVPGVVGGHRRERDGHRDHGVGGGPEARPGAVGQRAAAGAGPAGPAGSTSTTATTTVA